MNIAFVLFVAIVVAIVQGTVFIRWGLRRVDYSRKFNVNECYVGDQVEMVEVVSNRKFLPVPWIRMESMIHSGLRFHGQHDLDISRGELLQNHKSLLSMMPYTRVIRRHQVTCEQRGVFKLESVTMTSGDVFGLRNTSKRWQLDVSLTVYPAIVDIQDIPLPSHNWQGDITVKRWIVDDPFMISGVRDYRYGDPLNRVSWKSSARAGRLQVYNRDFTADHQLVIYVNVQDSETMFDTVIDSQLIERALSYAASIASYATSQGIPVGFGHNGHSSEKIDEIVRMESGGGAAHLTGLLETMAQVHIRCKLSFDAFLQQDVLMHKENVDYLILTAFVTDKMQDYIDQLKDNGNGVEVVRLEQGQPAPSEDMPSAAAAVQGGEEQ